MTVKSALKMMKPYRTRMMIIMSLAVVITGISAVTPFVNRNMIDQGLLQGDIHTVMALVLLLALLQIGGRFVEYLQRRQEIDISNDLGKRLKTEAFEHGLKLKPQYFKEQGFYKRISDALYDINKIMNIANNSFLTIFVVICKCVGAMIGLIILDWRLSILVAAIMPIKIWINIVIRKRAEKLSKQLMDDNKQYNSWLSNILSGITDIKLWNLGKKITAEYEGHVQTINESSKRLSLLTEKNTLFSDNIEFVLMNAIYILGAFLIMGEQITFGGLMAFITFAAYVFSPVNIIMELRIILKQITPSVDGLKRFNELGEENYAATLPLADKISTIEFRNVSISFGGVEILKNLSLKINRGEKVAIVGDNGSGKTSIINLLLRLYEPTEGEILMDGVPVTEYNIEDYRRKFSVVSQDIHLFQGTVKDNITFGKNADIAFNEDHRLKFCTETIENWDKHYETQVGSEGTKLSGGERQKVALLRALYHKSEVLVLDEPTSNYDKESDDEFNRYIQGNTDYDFYFIVTHRKGILPYMDKVLELENKSCVPVSTQ
ncbi:ATP-binding cassette, subfamily B [Sporobacter termitidis DSM 10068]|uniref:ATP-binding cassette, subfamily B n=1 Tax=Sporobacter termitidis DSM 10068 TaxID=1123282 RepID=A0A1M5WBJ7_9FIRM|nr:ABC transporter ATP-binding protein [Sporobacter termitidis]SHH84830.1 ATP-binding cassette, subfamily B [Sporobacter termitidis DSM 10068]